MALPIDPNAMAIAWHFSRNEDAKAAILATLRIKIVRMARNYSKRCQGHIDFDDFVSVGMVGAIKALHKYEPQSGDYEPYAMNIIRGEMLHLIRDHSLTIKVPGSVKETGWKITKFRGEFKRANGREPSQEEIAKSLNLSITRVDHCISISRRPKDTSAIEDHFGEPSSVDGGPLRIHQDKERSALMELYDEAVAIYDKGGGVSGIQRHFKITRAKAQTIYDFIDSRYD